MLVFTRQSGNARSHFLLFATWFELFTFYVTLSSSLNSGFCLPACVSDFGVTTHDCGSCSCGSKMQTAKVCHLLALLTVVATVLVRPADARE